MLKALPSTEKLQRLNRRQRKKHRVGEFQELVFELRVMFRQPLDGLAYDVFLDDFIDLIEFLDLAVGGMGGALPVEVTDGVVAAPRRGSPTESDRDAVWCWLRQRSEVAHADVGELFDGWYGHGK